MSGLGLTEWTQEDVRRRCDDISDYIGEWQGIPVPLGEDTPLVLAKGHPMRPIYEQLNQTGGVTFEIVSDDRTDDDGELLFSCRDGDVREDERVVNEWYSRKRQCRVLVFDRGGRRFSLTIPVSPDRSMDRLRLWFTTIGGADAWDLDAEHAARDTLRAMLTDRQWRHYDLTGTFLETSPRSRLTYMFRRLRPTIALTPRAKDGSEDQTLCIALLCLHPIGYYDRSWAGCMVPSDDVIAHLAWMRGDEAGYWGAANQHAPSSPEAGL